MTIITIETISGKSYAFDMPKAQADKQIMAIENIQADWFLIHNIRIKPEHIVAVIVEE